MFHMNRNYDKTFKPGNLLLLFKLLKGGYVWFFLSLVIAAAGAVLDVAAGYFIKEFTNAGLDENLESLFKNIGLFAILIIINIFVKFFVKFTSGQYTFTAVENIRNQIYQIILNFSYDNIENRHSSDLVTRILNDVKVLESFYGNNMQDLIYKPLVFIISFTFLFRLNYQLTLGSVAIVPLMLFLVSILSKPVGKYIEEIRAGQTEINSIAQKTSGNMDTIKIFRLNKYFNQKFKNAVNKEMDGYLKKNFLSVCLQPLGLITWNIPFLTTLVWGGLLILNDSFSPGELFSFLYLLQFMTNPLQGIPEIIAEVRGISVTAGRIQSVLDTPAEEEGMKDDLPEKTDLVIHAENLSFAYNEGPPILKNISFEVPQGKTVAIVGESGCGKSTLFKLLLGLYPPDSGSLKLFGLEYSQWRVKNLRDQFSLVSQHPFLFPVSLKDNISYGNPGLGIDEIEKVCKRANAFDFIQNLPEGINTNAGERGGNLSGGERQRITIARALLKGAPVLLLDEPTASLDTHSEAIIQEALNKIMKNQTVLVIAHRLSTIREADTILVLQDGQIAESGRHEELVEMKGLYHALYTKQVNES